MDENEGREEWVGRKGGEFWGEKGKGKRFRIYGIIQGRLSTTVSPRRRQRRKEESCYLD